MKDRKRSKILAIDDTPSNLIALEAVFSGSEFSIIEAHSGEEGLKILREHHDISIVLLDVQMPEMDGFETASRIKELPGCADIPIVFITAFHNDDPFVKRGFRAGAIDYFSKPFDPEILKMKVEMYSSFRQKSFLLKEREKRIAETEELFRAGRKLTDVLESLPVGILISDTEGTICQANEAVSKVLHTRAVLESDSYGELLGWWKNGGHVLKEENSILFKALKEGLSTHNVRINIPCVDGKTCEVLASASPLYGDKNKIVGAVIVIQDVTETKKIEEDFEEKLSKLISLSVEFEHNTHQ